MKGKSIFLAGTALSAVMLAMPAYAQDQANPQNQTVEQRLKALEDAQAAKDAADQARATRLSTLEQQVAETTISIDNARPQIQSADGRFLLAIRARLQVDGAFFNQASNLNSSNVAAKDLNSGEGIRRFFFGIEGRAFTDFWYEMRIDLGGANFELTNPVINLGRVAWNYGNLAYPAQTHFRINAGVIQPIFTYGDTVSSASTTFLERADVVNAATGAYGASDSRHGIELTFQQADLLYGGDNLVVSGAFTGGQTAGISNAAGSFANTDEGTQFLGRIAYRLWSDGFSNLQVGGSAAVINSITGSTAQGIRTDAIQDRPEVRVDGTRLVSTASSTFLVASMTNTATPIVSNIPETGGSMWGLEAEGNWRNFYLAGEYMNFTMDRDVSCGDSTSTNSASKCNSYGAGAGVNPGNPSFSGWYVEGSYILTGEMKTYSAVATNNEFGTFNGPRIVTPFSLTGGGWGGWEIAARYSDLDLNWHPGVLGQTVAASPVGGVRGGEEQIWTFGINWYLNNNVRTSFNYLSINVNKLGTVGSLSGTSQLVQVGQHIDALAMRLQFTN